MKEEEIIEILENLVLNIRIVREDKQPDARATVEKQGLIMAWLNSKLKESEEKLKEKK